MGSTFQRQCGCGPRTRRPDGVYFRTAEAEPTRSCLPQVDPLHSDRRAAVQAAAIEYSFRRCAAVGSEPDPHEWPVLLPSPLPRCEQHTEYLRDRLHYHCQVTEVIQDHLGDQVAAYWDAAERWARARTGQLGGICVGQQDEDSSSDRWGSLAEAAMLFSSADRPRGFPPPRVLDRWFDDSLFVQLRLTGPNASALRPVPAVSALPADLRCDDDALRGRLEHFTTLAAACEAGRIFAVDHSDALRGVVHYTAGDDGSAPLCNPIALFYLANNRQLCPICIQLYGAPDPDQVPHNHLYTPDDSSWAWNAAKMAFNQADYHYHFVCNVYARTVMAGAVIHAVTARTLSPHHPLRQVLRPHLVGCLAAAECMHSTLIGALETGRREYLPAAGCLALTAAEVRALASAAWAEFRLDPGFADVRPLPGLEGKDLYREDGGRLWAVVESHAAAIVRKYYPSAEEFAADSELHAWLRELAEVLKADVPPEDSTAPVEPLTRVVASVIFHGSALHRSRTAGFYDAYGCPLAFPGRPSSALPTGKRPDDVTRDDLVAMLPSKRDCVAQAAVAHVISGVGCSEAPHPWRFGDFGRELFVDRAANAIVEGLSEKLAAVEAAVSARNAALQTPYDAFRPTLVPNSFGSR